MINQAYRPTPLTTTSPVPPAASPPTGGSSPTNPSTATSSSTSAVTSATKTPPMLTSISFRGAVAPPVMATPIPLKGATNKTGGGATPRRDQQQRPPPRPVIRRPTMSASAAVKTPTKSSPTAAGSKSFSLKSPTTTATATAASNVRRRPRRKKPAAPTADILNCRYGVVREALESLGFDILDDGEPGMLTTSALLFWTDLSVCIDRVKKLENWQRCNHFPGMHILAHKVAMCNTIHRVQRIYPNLYSFFPKSWNLRLDKALLRDHIRIARYHRTYILKPNGRCQGKGIILTRNPLTEEVEVGVDYLVQEYISRPLLIEGKKFDMRVYVLITSVRVPSVFVFNEGLIRICAHEYAKPQARNMKNACMHLTNYAVNKNSEGFVPSSSSAPPPAPPTTTSARRRASDDSDDEEEEEQPQPQHPLPVENGTDGNKRDFRWFSRWLGLGGHNPDAFWGTVDDVVARTVLSAKPELEHVYNTCYPHHNDGFSCFEILGMDILIDTKLRPWLLEVNHSPSFGCDAEIDHRIKLALLQDTLHLVNASPEDRTRQFEYSREVALVSADEKAAAMRRWAEERLAYEDDNLGGFRRIVPSPSSAKCVEHDQIMVAASDVRNATMLRRRGSASM